MSEDKDNSSVNVSFSYDESVPVWTADGAYCRIRPDVSSLVFYLDVPPSEMKKGESNLDPTRKVILDLRIPTKDILNTMKEIFSACAILHMAGFHIEGLGDFKLEGASSEEFLKLSPTALEEARHKGLWVGTPKWMNTFPQGVEFGFHFSFHGMLPRNFVKGDA